MPELRDLPAVDTLLNDTSLQPAIHRHGIKAVRDRIRSMQADMRAARQVPAWGIDPAAYAAHINQSLRVDAYTPVFNLTGTIIHTNLGRALLSDDLWGEIAALITRPMNLEYDLA
jgi:L-seryl-tRNA(Ser) seleniumtransferase